MARVFVDVGTHDGQSLDVALDPRYGFSRLYGFEPSPQCSQTLSQFADPRLVIHPFGLGRDDAVIPLFASGTQAGSIYDEHYRNERYPARISQEEVVIRDASRWFAENLSPDDEVFLKLNCEGSEADIIERLASTGHLGWVDHVLLSLDIVRFPGQEHRGAQVLRLLDEARVEVVLRDGAMLKVEAWLTRFADRRPGLSDRWRYWSAGYLRGPARWKRTARRGLGQQRYVAVAQGLRRLRAA